MKHLLTLLICLYSSLSIAAIYMEKDRNGNIIYSDIPQPNASTIQPGKGNTVSTPATSSAPQAQPLMQPQPKQHTAQSYQTVRILSPKDQETIQNQPVINVALKTEPELLPDDKIQIYVDGKPWGKPASKTEFQIVQLERGTHQLGAKIIDKNAKVLNTFKTITIFVHRASVLLRPH